ncbi:DUF6350 family protein [Psychromicrobium lacuslunae]|uniref:Membrane protein n=1 Tax=Psychromicrobium lacuslunae TaxID=1618207 RepID=A0A0D4C2C5_9MICC|nr:DUF6350 family protein [Psychromicrobium lacuslunae]AJT42694.1 membrane protein [Psychromicrobium lacuslunae]
MKLTRGQSGQRGIPMPLWLQGVLESAQLAIIVAALMIVPVGAVYFSNGFGNQPFDSAARLAGQAWLLVHGVPLQISVATGASSAELHSGLLSLIPFGLTLIPFFFAWRAGRRLARASYTDQLWQALCGALLIYAALGFATGYICSDHNVSASLLMATLVPLIPVALGLVIGARREAGSWGRLIGVDTVERMARFSQRSRWAGSYLWSVVKAGFLAVIVLMGISALIFAVNLALHWADVVAVYQGLKTGPVGGAALTIAQLGYFPNLAVWTMAWSSGSGFAVGIGSSVGPLGTSVAPLPAIPLLGALPVGQLSWGVLALAVPVLAGLLAGWWFLREGENHFDEWLSIKVPQRWLSASLSTISLALLVGLGAGILAAVLAWLSGGSAGIGRLSEVGPQPLNTAFWVACEVALGVLIGSLVAPWLEGARQRAGLAEDFEPFEEAE